MLPMIFVNLPVTDLKRSIDHYRALGWVQNPQFSDETAACMVWSDTIHAMLLTHPKWRSFTDRTIPDAQTSAQVLLCLSVERREDVDRMADTSGASGGTADPNRRIEFPFMYSRSLADPDGHIWEIMWMDAGAAPPTPDAVPAS